MKNSAFRIALWILGGFFASLLLSVLYYLVFILLFSSDMEKRMMEENRLYEKYLPQVAQTAELLDGEIDFLTARDEYIYHSVFKADAPSVSEMIEGDILLEDIDGDEGLVSRAALQSERALAEAAKVDECWREILDSLASPGYRLPPMITPVNDLIYTNIGASIGDKISPFYKVSVHHDGLDIIAPAQTPVHATAPGRVTNVRKSQGGSGNMVEITHSGGYITRYAHLADTKLKKDQVVKAGTLIGTVGDSGRSFTTHLHYEVEKNGVKLDPNAFFLGSITPDEYLKFMIMSASSGQSMD